MSEPTISGFDYGQLAGDDWQFVQDARDEIRRRGKQTIENVMEIGRLLTEVKARLPHGQWLPWLAVEFRWSETSARRFMDSHQLIKSSKLEDLPGLLELSPSAIAELAAASTPEPARQEVLEQVASGNTPTTAEVKRTIHAHKVERAREAAKHMHVEPVVSITAPPAIKVEPVEPVLVHSKRIDDPVEALLAAWRRASWDQRDEFLARTGLLDRGDLNQKQRSQVTKLRLVGDDG